MKLTATAAAVLACCAFAVQPQPPLPPSQYAAGPATPNVAATNITDAEEEALLLLECALKQIEGVILAKNATTQLGTYPITVQTDGLIGGYGKVTVSSGGATFNISGTHDVDTFWGKQYSCFEAPGVIESFNGVGVADFSAHGEYNSAGTILDFVSVTRVQGINSNPADISSFDIVDGNMIKDIYEAVVIEASPSPSPSPFNGPHIIHRDYQDWGLQEISKNGFPQQKYWQRSQSWPSDATSGCTAIVLDRLVGPSPVRIAVLIEGTDSLDWFSETGHIYITHDTPGTPVFWPAFTCSFGAAPG